MATTPQEGKSLYERINDEDVMMPLAQAARVLEAALMNYRPDPVKQVQAIGEALKHIREAMHGSNELKAMSILNKSERVRGQRRKARVNGAKEPTQ